MDAQTTAPRRAIVVVDMLICFCRSGALYSPRYDPIVPPMREHLAAAEADGRAAHLPGGHARVPTTRSSRCSRRTAWRAPARTRSCPSSASSRTAGTVVRKRTFSGFHGTELDAVLAAARAAAGRGRRACAPTSACCTPSPACGRAATRCSCTRTWWRRTTRRDTTPEEFNRFALAHVRDVLGARVE